MVLIISTSRKTAEVISDMFYYMGVISYAATPTEALSEFSGLYRAALLVNPEALPDHEDFVSKHPDAKVYYFSAKGSHAHTEVEYPDEVYLMFGRETKGLPMELIEANPDTTLRIPMIAHQRCLNLSNAVAVAVYEVLRQDNFDTLSRVRL